MKVCPHCQNKYTDDTLQFCLQDGKSLEIAGDDKTLVLDDRSFADEKTIAENHKGKNQSAPKEETHRYEHQQTNAGDQATDTDLIAENNTAETLVRPQTFSQAPTPVDHKPKNKIGGLGILAGFTIALVLIGLITIAVLGVIYLPAMMGENANNNSQLNNPNKERTLNDTNDVKVSASSSRKAEKGNFYMPRLAFDGNSRTGWCEGAKGTGRDQWIAFDFNEEVTLKKIVIEPGYFKTDELWQKNNRLASATIKFSDGTIKSVKFPDDMKEQIIDTDNIKTKSVMLTIKDVYEGRTDSEDTLISEVSFIVE